MKYPQIITEEEFESRFSRQVTQLMARRCLYCNILSVWPAQRSDGALCPECGMQTAAVAFLRAEGKLEALRRVQHHEHREADEQEALITWAQYAVGKYPDLEWLYHIPNGGKRSKAEAARLKAQGVKAGVPDLCLPVSRGGMHGLYIELKAEGGSCSSCQKKWIRALAGQGYAVAVCVGFEAAKEKIIKYLEADK